MQNTTHFEAHKLKVQAQPITYEPSHEEQIARDNAVLTHIKQLQNSLTSICCINIDTVQPRDTTNA